ncbi:adenine deaminase C-terminal domain-containing protein [Texcoconibacillus texcoconensis]|uniref:adenine deaminase n=1 Tax=Texcoconibacillus texcoconensis TaxID=1095777 RepID=A0A840QMF0_9BACI|nr:adenine deaminase C-terminal domain-containing protein [Texcoconibacillus texcoconensis]MBB5172554.1 adenine deaminase [Texcoconibacillus texcoconensis]
MVKSLAKWSKTELRRQLEVVRGHRAPTKLLKNALYFIKSRRKWVEGNIWIYHDRIVYTGENLPTNIDGTEVVDCEQQMVVPGYIEPHAHPFQLYSPHRLAEYAARYGTTTLINDNLGFLLECDKKKAFTVLEEYAKIPSTMLWWARYDTQTAHKDEHLLSHSLIHDWINHPDVIQGGELTDWLSVLQGDDDTLHLMQETKNRGKRIEGHLPGAGENTLVQMALLGVSADHESITGDDVIRRLDLGYFVSLRHSSIRPDLPHLLSDLQRKGIQHFDDIMMTTDGSPPSFYEQGLQNQLLKIAIDTGIPFEEAISMVTENVARYYGIDEYVGKVAPGRIAHLNMLQSTKDPTPHSVLAKGEWVKKNGQLQGLSYDVNSVGDFNESFALDWSLSEEDLHFSMPVGVEMVNDVILKPYSTMADVTKPCLPAESDECYFMFIDRNGNWTVNTILKGFAKSLYGFASSFSVTGDIILIGKDKRGLLDAFEALKNLGGGMVLLDEDGPVAELPLHIGGMTSDETLETLIEQEKSIVSALKERGYPHDDPIYSLLFFAATHLPYIRITPQGIYDVKKKMVLFPSIMR